VAPRNKVAAVVVTYNRKELLRECLTCLLTQEGASCDVVVVDNASTDGTAAMIDAEFCVPRVRYLNTGANLGGAGGFMCGIEAAVMLGYDYIWVMDDDSLPTPTALHELLETGKELGDWGFLSSAVYWTDGTLCKANRVKRSLFRHVSEVDAERPPSPIVMGSFVSMLIPSRVVREVGLPVAEYFIWTDDYEYSGRISKLHPCYFVPASKVTHAMKDNTRADLVTANGDRINRFRVLYRNDMHCYRQHGFPGYAYLAAKGAYTGVDVMLHCGGDRFKKLKVLLEGYRDGRSFSPRVRMVGGDDDQPCVSPTTPVTEVRN